MSPVAIITGATGQDGSYLSELLLEKGYTVFCMIRRSTYPIQSSNLTSLTLANPKLRLFDADLTDQSSIMRVFNEASEYDVIEVYNLAAQSHVAISFECPALTVKSNVIGTLNLLESIRQSGLIK